MRETGKKPGTHGLFDEESAILGDCPAATGYSEVQASALTLPACKSVARPKAEVGSHAMAAASEFFDFAEEYSW